MPNTDQIKGRIKEAAGDLTDDQSLENEGKVDRAAGDVKDKVETAKDKVGDAVDAAKDKISGILHKD